MNVELSTFYVRLGTIALIMVLGFLLGKLKLISEKTNRELSNLLLVVFMPAALFSAFPTSYDEEMARFFFSGLIGGAIVMLAVIVLSKLIFNKHWYREDNLRYESQFALAFNNATFLGYPIISSTFGMEGILAYSGFIVMFNLALFSYGIWLFERKISWKLVGRVLINPNILAVLFGMVLFLTNLRLPEVIAGAVSYVGGATTPLSLICIGFMLSRARFGKILKKWRLALTALIQLIIGPLATFGLLRLLQFPTEVVQVCTLIQALPTATSLGLFAVKYDGNEAEASELVTISTLFSVGTLPLMIFLLLGN